MSKEKLLLDEIRGSAMFYCRDSVRNVAAHECIKNTGAIVDAVNIVDGIRSILIYQIRIKGNERS